ncbi:MAG: hypothetical protein WCG01_01765 [bacterium]
MIQTSEDLLRIVLAFCALWLTIFIAWFIYYMAMIMRQFFLGTREMRERIHKVDTLIDDVRTKIEHSSSYLLLIGEGIKKLIQFAYDKTEKKSAGKKR